MKLIKKMLAAAAAILLLTLCLCGAAEEAPQQTPTPARGYVRVTMGYEYHWLALPEEEPYDITIKQVNPETGEEYINIITLTPEGVYMKESTCDNQDCVDEGIVTIDNRQERILGNLIVCLPHQIMLELFTPDEILAMMAEENAR